ncbi:MAG TPA: NADH-quinone oxidoreductase subunit NuoE [Kaistiaceae bacterium]|nr:NADH-quinone oxidoreductase subunit NuoE [Kaistiaceae bacterium]
MSVRRLHHEQPESFAMSPDNEAWAKAQLKKYPPGREQSAVIPILWRVQEQEGWVSKPAIEWVAAFLGMPPIRVLEVATFYTMFQLQPVGRKAHIQVCGTTPCMIRGADRIIKICKSRIAEHAHEISADGDFSWEEVECLGACVNAPMVQVVKDTYEDLTPESFEALIDTFARGEKPTPGPQTKRQFAAPEGTQSTLTDPALYAGAGKGATKAADAEAAPKVAPAAAAALASGLELTTDEEEAAMAAAIAELPRDASAEDKANAVGSRPGGLAAPEGEADDLKRIRGIGKVNEAKLADLGIFHFRQIAAWTRAEIRWVGTYLAFAGRIDREDWVGQAKVLAEGGDTEFSKRVDAGDVPSSED